MDRHRKTVRLQNYDYTTPGAYLVTICTDGNKRFFGKIVGSSAELSVIGKVVEKSWLEIHNHFENVDLDAFVVMPDHFHGILTLRCRGTACRAQLKEDFSQLVPESLSTIVRSFKSAVTRRVRGVEGYRNTTVWQGGYYERVIRKTENINQVREYILNNPLRWSLRERT